MTSTDPVAGRFRHVTSRGGFEIWFDPGALAPPAELHLEIRGWRAKRVDAYWNGCIFVP
jgi:hypothetical protein